MKKRFLVVSPHPDDAELGMGGTIIKLKQKGHKVFMVDLTSGEPTPYGAKAIRMKETQKSNKVLKIDARVNLGLENRYLFDSKDSRIALSEKIRLFKPDIILCPFIEDAHPDHMACTKITEAARFYAKYTKTTLKGKPRYCLYLIYYFCSHLRIIPQISFLIDISNQYKRKIDAIKCYRSQFVINPKNKFIFNLLRSQNRFLGKLIRTQYAEAFYSKELIKIDDFTSLL